MDRYQKFGLVMVLLAAFLFAVFAKGSEKILFIGGFFYGFVFIFHTFLEKIIVPRLKRPLFAYGIAVILNGLFMEVLAYLNNLDRIRAGEPAFLFATSSLRADIIASIPYYVTFALVFAWLLKTYYFSTFQFGFIVWLAQAASTDVFHHLIALFYGGIGDIMGFVISGIIMLWTLHAPIVIFENALQSTYPLRKTSWIKYPLAFVLQMLPIAVTFIIGFTHLFSLVL